MKKVFMILSLATGMIANVFGQGNVGTALTGIIPATSPPNISQLEVRGRSITKIHLQAQVYHQL